MKSMSSELGRPRNGRNGNGAIAVAVLLVTLVVASPARAQDVEPERAWSNATELGWVFTEGNAQTNSFNLRNVFEYEWPQADLTFEFGILRADSGDDRFALGTEDDFEIIEPDVEPDNERIHAKVRYLKNVSDLFFWYGRLDAEKDQPADINYRLTPAAGAGNNWADGDDLTFRTGYGLSYSAEDLTLDGGSNYSGYQMFYELEMKATDSTSVESNLTFDGSLKTASNYRFNWLNGVSVAISDTIALKASLRLVYRNDPALEEIDLEDPDGAVVGNVIVLKKKLDSGFTTSLVINF